MQQQVPLPPKRRLTPRYPYLQRVEFIKNIPPFKHPVAINIIYCVDQCLRPTYGCSNLFCIIIVTIITAIETLDQSIEFEKAVIQHKNFLKQ